MTEPRTVKFWEALKSAEAKPGEKWYRGSHIKGLSLSKQDEELVFYFDEESGLFCCGNGEPFLLGPGDVDDDWTCES